jgi:hypothetical protein
MPDSEPTVPLIVYLFADRLIPKQSHLSDGTHVPCSGHVVETQALATLLFATGFWGLREAGLLAMEVADIGNGHREVRLKQLEESARPGLEGAILSNLGGQDALSEVVLRWSASRSTDPWHDGVREVVAEGVGAGFLHEVPPHGGVLARWFSGGSALEPDCVRIAGLMDRYESFTRSWGRFKSEESALHEALSEECRRALLASSERWYP